MGDGNGEWWMRTGRVWEQNGLRRTRERRARAWLTMISCYACQNLTSAVVVPSHTVDKVGYTRHFVTRWRYPSVCLSVCLSVCRQRLLLLRTCWPQQYWDSRNMGAPHDIVSSSCNNLYPQWNLCWRRGLTHGTTLVERALSHKHTGKLPTSSVVWVFPCALVHGALNVCVL